MEADTPGKYEVEREEEEEEIEMKEKYSPESHWFAQMSPDRTLTWKPREKRYKYSFFNVFNPKTILNRSTKENRWFRSSVVANFVEGVDVESQLMGKKLPFLKNIGFRREGPISSRFEYTYNGELIGIFDPTLNEDSSKGFTKVEGQAAKDLVKDVSAYFNLKIVEEVKPQIKSIMTGDQPREKLTPPSRPPTPPKPSKLNSIWDSVKSVASYSRDWMNQKGAENLDNTAVKSADITTESYFDIYNQSFKNQLDSYQGMSDENQGQIDQMNQQIMQQSREIGDKKEEIRRLKEQIETSREENDELNQEIAKLNNDLRLMETDLENIKAKKDKIKVYHQSSQTQELQDNLDITASQILQRDEEIKLLQNKLKANEEYVKRFPQEKANYETTIVNLENTLKYSNTENKKLKDSYEAAKLELEEKNNSPDEISKKVESLQSLLKTEKGKVKNLRQSKREVEGKNRSLVADFDRLNENYKAAKIRLENEELIKEETILKLKALEKENKELLDNKENLSDERVLELQQEKESIEKELQDERDSYSKLVKSKENLEKEYNNLDKKFKSQQAQWNQYSRTMQEDLDKATVQKGEYEKLQQERDELIEKNKELTQSLGAYKLGLEAEKSRSELDSNKELQKFKDSNEKLQSLQQQLNEKTISEEKFKRLFTQNQNRHDIIEKSLKETIEVQSNNIDELTKRTQAQETRIQELEKIESYYLERTKVKDAEVQEQIDRVKEKEEEKEKLINEISRQEVLLDQYKNIKRNYEEKTRDYNQLATDLSGSVTKRDTLEKELADTQKERDSLKLEMENLKKEMIDPKEFEESKNHARELSAELDKKERLLFDTNVEANHFRQETENLREYIQNQKEVIESEMLDVRKFYEAKIEKREKEFKDQLKNYVRPGDLKAYNMNWEKVDEIEVREYSKEDLENVLKKLRTIRDKYRRDAENPSHPSGKRRMDDRFRKNVDYKIDAINHKNGKAIETSQGRDIILEDKKGILGSLYRMNRWLWDTGVKYLGVFGSIITIITGAFYLFCMATGRTIVQGVKDAARLINKVAGNLPLDLSNMLLEGSKIFLHYAKNTLVIATLVIISFLLVYKAFISSSQTEFLVSGLLLGGVIGLGYWYTSE